MNFIGYQSDALGAAVDLVNAVGGEDVDLREVIARHGYRAAGAPRAVEQALRDWAERLRTVFEVSSPDAAARAANALLDEVDLAPHLTNHDGEPWHLHYTPPKAPLVERVRATTAFALATLVGEYGVERHGRCAAGGCRRVYADTSRNRARRYCGSACANRTAVAAHRLRAKRAQPVAGDRS